MGISIGGVLGGIADGVSEQRKFKLARDEVDIKRAAARRLADDDQRAAEGRAVVQGSPVLGAPVPEGYTDDGAIAAAVQGAAPAAAGADGRSGVLGAVRTWRDKHKASDTAAAMAKVDVGAAANAAGLQRPPSSASAAQGALPVEAPAPADGVTDVDGITVTGRTPKQQRFTEEDVERYNWKAARQRGDAAGMKASALALSEVVVKDVIRLVNTGTDVTWAQLGAAAGYPDLEFGPRDPANPAGKYIMRDGGEVVQEFVSRREAQAFLTGVLDDPRAGMKIAADVRAEFRAELTSAAAIRYTNAQIANLSSDNARAQQTQNWTASDRAQYEAARALQADPDNAWRHPNQWRAAANLMANLHPGPTMSRTTSRDPATGVATSTESNVYEDAADAADAAYRVDPYVTGKLIIRRLQPDGSVGLWVRGSDDGTVPGRSYTTMAEAKKAAKAIHGGGGGGGGAPGAAPPAIPTRASPRTSPAPPSVDTGLRARGGPQ